MNHETKRDVFEVAMNHAMKSGWLDYDDMINRYATALPDDLPVIPEAVGEILRSAHGQTNLLGVLSTAKSGREISDTLAWIVDNQNTFARAWLLGVWRVEGTGEIVELEMEE